ncbi:MAG: TIGR04282 family arsenosugar biosynthesis glycosyltransferase [Burkholderiales bacterium]|nr:TIGR04282 family arsenosugar biosynthesis glycosyltransferase [Burkholderiales bacterium]
MASDTVIVVFAKAPVAGDVKTRLIPTLSAELAARLHVALTERVLQTAVASGADVLLSCAPDAAHPFFKTSATDFGVGLSVQLRDGDLGARMLHAITAALEHSQRVIIVGADCPALTVAHLTRAISQLATQDVVLTPAADGGYVLIGACRTHAAMFDDIDWGTDAVLKQQRARLQAAGLTWHEMETLWDVDRPEDLARLISLKPPLAFAWPT